MGGRHQLFVVAQINGRFRRLAALYNQYLAGKETLEQCLMLLRIFEAQANRIPIQQELIAAKRCGPEVWPDPKVWKKETRSSDGTPWVRSKNGHAFYFSSSSGSDDDKSLTAAPSLDHGRQLAPFPFIATCLLIGKCSADADWYQSPVHLLPYNMRIDSGDNNDGITILDITNPSDIRYCFAYLKDELEANEEGRIGAEVSGEDARGQHIIPKKKPLRAQSYLKRYLNKESRAQFRRLIRAFQAYSLIDEATLEELIEGLDVLDSEIEGSPITSRPSASWSSLSEIAANKVLQVVLEQSQLPTDLCSEALLVPETRALMTNKLYKMAESGNLEPSSALIKLMCAALQKEDFVDLGPFENFSSSDLCSIIVKLQEYGNLTSLNISNLRINEDDFLGMLGPKSSIQTLYLLGESQICLRTIHRIIENSEIKLRKVYHPELFRRPFEKDESEFHNIEEQTKYLESLATNYNLKATNDLVSAIWVCINGEPNEIRTANGAEAGRIDWQKIANSCQNSGANRDYGSGFRLRYGYFPLHDVVMPPTRIVDGLMNFRKCMNGAMNKQAYDARTVGLTFAKAVAMASSHQHQAPYEIGPLPGALYTASSFQGGGSWPLRMPELVPGQWTLIMIHEVNLKSANIEQVLGKMRYAFISRRKKDARQEEAEYRVLDMAFFLSETMGSSIAHSTGEKERLMAFWEKQGKDELLDVCDSDEVHEMIPVLKKEIAFKHARNTRK